MTPWPWATNAVRRTSTSGSGSPTCPPPARASRRHGAPPSRGGGTAPRTAADPAPGRTRSQRRPAACRGRPPDEEDDGDPGPLAEALAGWVEANPVWHEGVGDRVLLVDLDNLRAGAVRWKARMGLVVALARTADHVVISGEHAAVERGLPFLAEFGPSPSRSRTVPTSPTTSCSRAPRPSPPSAARSSS